MGTRRRDLGLLLASQGLSGTRCAGTLCWCAIGTKLYNKVEAGGRDRMISSKLHIAADGAGGREQFHRRRLLPSRRRRVDERRVVVERVDPTLHAGWAWTPQSE